MRKRVANRVDRWSLVTAAILCLLVITSAAGCSSDADRPSDASEPDAQPDPFSSWAVHIYAGEPGDQTRVDVPPPSRTRAHAPPPVGEVNADWKPGDSLAAGFPAAPALAPKTLVEGTDGGMQAPPYDESAYDKDHPDELRLSWLLLWAAATECGMVGPPITGIQHEGYINPYLEQTPAVPPWEPGSWFIFERAPVSCSQNLAFQETLLCISQHLSDAADAVSPITWTGPAKVSELPAGFPEGPYVIPPQRDADRFVLRSMAMYVLAHIAYFDPAWVGLAEDEKTACAELYSDALQNPKAAPNEPAYLFAEGLNEQPKSAHFDIPMLDIDDPGDYAKMVRTRMTVQAHVLRGASRLAKDLIEKSVYADLAGTEKRRAAETDPLRGAKLAWGVPKGNEAPYNTLSHAVRVLAGRWEMSPYIPDWVCGGVPAWNLLQGAYGPSISARYEDRASVSEAQRKAVQLIDAAGIVLPESALENEQPDTIRTAVEEQLLINAAAKQGITKGTDEYDDFVTSGQGAVIAAQLDDVRDGDLTFALARSLGAFRMLASAGDSVDPSTAAAGLTKVGDTSGVAALGGTALAEGMPRGDLAVDITSRAAGMLGASQCSTPLQGEVRPLPTTV